MLQIIIPVLIGAVIAAIIAGFIAHSAGRSYERKQYDSKVGSAEEKAREIIDEALKTAETKKREALLEAKEESLKTKNELEKETKERRAELQRYEKRVLSKEENVEKKADALEKKEADLVRRENILGERTAEVEAQYEQGIQELERISGLTSEQAKEYLLKSVEEDVKHDTAKLIKELENKAKEEADKKADSYDEILQAANYYLANDMTKAADAFNQIEESSMTGKGQELYATLKTALADYVFTEAYNAGATAFASGDYKTAITQLKKATEAKTDDFNAWYYLAFSYRNNNDTKKANKIFRQIVQQFPTQAAAYNISSYITSDTSSGSSTTNATQGTTTGGTDTTNTAGTTDTTNAAGTTDNTTGAADTTGGDQDTTGNDTTGNDTTGDNGTADINNMFGIE